MGLSNPASSRGSYSSLQSRDRLGGRLGRDLGAAAVRRGRARVHLGADQRLARALGGDPRRAGGRRLRAGQSAYRCHVGLRRNPCRGAERDERDGRESGLAADGRGLRPDPAALSLAPHRGPNGPLAQAAGVLDVVPARSRGMMMDQLAAWVSWAAFEGMALFPTVCVSTIALAAPYVALRSENFREQIDGKHVSLFAIRNR